MKVSAYIPCYNNKSSIITAVNSILDQTHPVDELIVIDDGSTDGSTEKLNNLPISIHKTNKNMGRGYVRNLAMELCKNEFILCCDATNIIGPDFISIALQCLLKHTNACSVSGPIKSYDKSNLVSRWRSRHLFKDYIQHKPNSTSVSSLITYGTLMKKSVILELGNFNPFLKHSEDEDMAFRINKSKYYSLGNSDLEIICVIKNSLFEVYERYWRWNIGRHEKFSAKTYFNNVKCSIKPMAQIDISNNDYFSAVLSLIYPHYFILKSISNYFSVNKNIID